MLIEESGLISPDAGRAPISGWADPVEHARMLDDDRRTGDYLAALAAGVRPGDVVLDIGTGTGVLAVAAARAGARRVYAVEATDIAVVAERVFEANGVQDRVTLVPGWSRQIELPEKADVLVAEVIGNEPFEEEILETTLDARRRLLKPGARLIPHTLTLMARPVLLPEGEFRQRAFGRAAIERWRALYDIDFQPLLDAAIPGPVHTITEGEVVATWPQMGPPVVLASIDLTTFEAAVGTSIAPISWSIHRVRSTRSPSRSAPTCTRASRTPSILGGGRRPAGRPPSGCSPTRCMSARDRCCACTTTAGCPGTPDGLTCEVVDRGARLSRPRGASRSSAASDFALLG